MLEHALEACRDTRGLGPRASRCMLPEMGRQDKHVADGKLTVTDGRELEQLHFILRDFAVLLQVSQIKVRSRSDQGQIKGRSRVRFSLFET